MTFFAKVQAFFASLFHAEEAAVAPIAQQAVSEALAEAPEVAEAGLTGGNALKVAGAALQKIGTAAAAQAVPVSVNTAMVMVSNELEAQAPGSTAKASS